MLVELLVENFAIVDSLRVRFHPGLNLLTGETGSGKSILIDALTLLFGGRASAEMVRSGAASARISGIFEAPAGGRIEELGAAVEDGEVLIEREVLANGKSRAFLGGRPVTATALRELAPLLGDIHGQHDQQQLFDGDAQLEMLDGYAGAEGLLEGVAAAFGAWREASARLEELDRGEQDRLRMLDLWTFQRAEIEEVGLRAGEDAELEAERRILQNSTRIEEQASAAYALIYDAPQAALAQITQARKKLEDLLRFDPALEETLAVLRPAEIGAEEASHALRHYLGKLEADPARLDTVENRLAAIDKLRRKYGATADEILAFLADVKEKLDRIENASAHRERAAKDRDRAAAAYQRAAGELTRARTRAAGRLAEAVQAELSALSMGGSQFRISLEEAEWSARGSDRVRFLLSANRGEEARALEKVASGGELSRLALALKTCLIEGAAPVAGVQRTLVFDEVDSGVGGRAAETVGRRLKRLSSAHQLLCVTHLPQVAAFADHHYVVEKRVLADRTVATIQELEADGRPIEIGRMLSGAELTDEALRHAEQLIRAGASA